MTGDPGEVLLGALDAGDVEAVAKLAATLDEPSRRALAPAVQAFRIPWRDGAAFQGDRNAVLEAWHAARLATSSLTELKQRWRDTVPSPEIVVRIIAARRPPWIDEWVAFLLAREGGWPSFFWPAVRALIREGLCARPDSAGYIDGMLGGIYGREGWRHAREEGYLEGRLLEDPGLLEHEVWRIFEVSGLPRSWAKALGALAAAGKLSRDRLLDAGLQALSRDLLQSTAGTFSHFHESLEPTLEERASCAGLYLTLLSSRIPPTVSFALRALQLVEERVDPEHLLSSLGPPLSAKARGTVKETFALLAGCVERAPQLAAAAVRIAAEALAHASPEVHREAIDFLERFGGADDEETAAVWRARLEEVAASQRGRLARWLGTARVEEPAVAVAEVVERAPAPLRAAREPIAPVADLDELLDSLAALLEAPDQPEELERALDGLSRLCAERPDELTRRAAPLRKRAQARIGRWPGPFHRTAPLRDSLAGVVISWLDGKPPADPKERPASINAFLCARLVEVATRAAHRRAAPLLALPTHRAGWIAPAAFLERGLALRSAPDLHDAVQALLRLAPEGRDDVLGRFPAAGSEIGQAFRYALGAEPPPHSSMTTPALRVAASRARDPLAEDPTLRRAFPELEGPDLDAPARYDLRVTRHKHWCSLWLRSQPQPPRSIPSWLPTVALHRGSPPPSAEWPNPLEDPGDPALAAWAALVWPAGHEAYYAAGARLLGNNLNWHGAEWANRRYLEPLLASEEPMGEMGRLLLALALAAKEPGESGLAVDVLIASLEEGRLDGARIGATLATLLPTGLLVPGRLARTLSTASQASALHRAEIVRAIELALRGDPASAPRGLDQLLELLQELLASSGRALDDAAARDFLRGLVGASRAGRLARALLGAAASTAARA